MTAPLLEVCVDSPAGMTAAVAGGADRLELCSALALGGLTPSLALMGAAARLPIPVFALIRPRAGDFHYTASEVALICGDILAARNAGLAGVVIGASRADGRLDVPALNRMADAAGPIVRTLHRVFDLVPDWYAALEAAVDLGFSRILSSGGEVNAIAGRGQLAQMIQVAKGRIGILPGSGITAENVALLREAVPFTEVHASCSEPVIVNPEVARLGFAGPGLKETSAQAVRALKAALLAAE